MWIQSEDYDGVPCSLVCTKTNQPVYRGDVMSGHMITGGRAPQKPSSTGRVWVEGGGEYFPIVVGAKWVRAEA